MPVDATYRCMHNYARTDPTGRRCPNRAAPGSVYCLEHRAAALARIETIPPKRYRIEPLRLPTKGVRHES